MDIAESSTPQQTERWWQRQWQSGTARSWPDRSGRDIRSSGRRRHEPGLLLDRRPVRVWDSAQHVQHALRDLLFVPHGCPDSALLARGLSTSPPLSQRPLHRVGRDRPAAAAVLVDSALGRSQRSIPREVCRPQRGFFAIIALCVSGGTHSSRSLDDVDDVDDVDDAAERCYWYSAPVGYMTSSVLYVMTTQLATTLVPTVCLFVAEAACAGRIRYLSVARETRRVPDTEAGGAGTSPVVEPPSNPRRNQRSLPRVKSSVTAGRPSAHTLCWRLAEDVVCLSVLLCYRIAFCTCSCDSFKVYGVLMTGLLSLSAAKLVLFACLCWRFI